MNFGADGPFKLKRRGPKKLIKKDTKDAYGPHLTNAIWAFRMRVDVTSSRLGRGRATLPIMSVVLRKDAPSLPLFVHQRTSRPSRQPLVRAPIGR
jgi:hypothetical protein